MRLVSIQTLAFTLYCSPVQGRMADTHPMFTSLIAWLVANMFIKVHELHSLTKVISYPAEGQ